MRGDVLSEAKAAYITVAVFRCVSARVLLMRADEQGEP